jgi:hypothetical protein
MIFRGPAGPENRLRSSGIELLLASSIALFQELAFIRWLPGEVRVVAYFPNLILIAAFLGLGAGSLRGGSKSLLIWWPVSVVITVLTGVLLSGVAFTAEGISEHLWLLYYDLGEAAPVVEGIRLPILGIFALVTFSFVPLGQVIGRKLQVFREAGFSLRGYAADLGGSLAGVILFGWLSFGALRPVWWFAPFLLAGFVLVRKDRRTLVVHLLATVLVLVAVVRADDAQIYSPYYALSAVQDEDTPNYRIRANGAFHQLAADVNTPDRFGGGLYNGYRIPHRSLGRPIRKALVLGAGTGNDVAVLLSEGVEEVHAVEIDPSIIQLGREFHPNQPYGDPRVTVHNMDARSFLNESEELFDLIVFGTLDSMTRLSALSNVRLDNFVYTKEALAAARARLSVDGGLALYFMVGQGYIHDHLVALLAATFEEMPRSENGDYWMFNSVYLAGPGFAHLRVPDTPETHDRLMASLAFVDLPSDDWPYLYMESRAVTPFYLSMMLTLVALGFLFVFGSSPDMRRALRGRGGADPEMFLFGVGFLLIETKFVTAMNLLWGATWITSAVVFGAILATVLIGTLLADRVPISWRTAGIGLVLALLAVYAFPIGSLARSDGWLRLGLSACYVGVPVFFAALCFADRFRVRRSADLAFGWNLLGAVCGGLLEFFSMSLGFRALTLVAIVAYLLAFLLATRAEGISDAQQTLADARLKPV